MPAPCLCLYLFCLASKIPFCIFLYLFTSKVKLGPPPVPVPVNYTPANLHPPGKRPSSFQLPPPQPQPPIPAGRFLYANNMNENVPNPYHQGLCSHLHSHRLLLPPQLLEIYGLYIHDVVMNLRYRCRMSCVIFTIFGRSWPNITWIQPALHRWINLDEYLCLDTITC
jgi:hypothetical protein